MPTFRLTLALAFTLAAIANLAAQPLSSEKDLSAAWNENSKRLRALVSGDEKAKKGDKADMKVAEAAARWYIYRITLRSSATYTPQKVLDEFNRDIESMMGKNISTGKQKENRAFIDMFGPALVESMKEVLKRDIKKEPATVVQAAMMLQTMGKLKQEDIGAYLAELTKGTGTHDAVRVYAIKGIKESFPIAPVTDKVNIFNRAVLDRMHAETKQVDALVHYIERPIKVKGMTAEEIAVLRYLRREAIVALAQAGAPAVVAAEKPQKIDKEMVQHKGLVAPTLMKVLANNLQPEATLQEKIEAAIGLCQMKYTDMPEYNAEIGVYLTGRMLHEFMTEYATDFANFTAATGKKVPYIAWKTESLRIKAALAELKKNTKDAAKAAGEAETKASKNAAALEARILSSKVLDTIYDYRSIPNPLEFANYVQTLKPADGKAFKSQKAPPITLD